MNKKTITYISIGLFLVLGLAGFWGYYFTKTDKANKEPLIVDSPINREIAQLEKEADSGKQSEQERAKINAEIAKRQMQKKNINEAMKRASKAVKEMPSDIESRLILAESFMEKYRWHSAAIEYQNIIKMDNNNAEAHYGLGQCYQVEKKYREAKAQYEKALAIDAKHQKAMFDLGLVIASLGDTDGAIRQYQRAVAAYPAYANGYKNLGILYERKDNKAKATQMYKKYLEFDPDDLQVNYWLEGLEGKSQ